jgi:hypothetical protein
MVFSICEQSHFIKESLKNNDDVTKKNEVLIEKDGKI